MFVLARVFTFPEILPYICKASLMLIGLGVLIPEDQSVAIVSFLEAP